MNSSWQTTQWPVAVVFIAAAFAVSTIALSIRTYRSYKRLSQFPGPISGAFSKWWMIVATKSGELPQRIGEVSRKYGSLARIGPNDLVTDDAEVLRTINALRSPFVRSDWYNATAFSHQLNHVFCEKDDTLHAEKRNKLIPGYSGRDNENLEKQIDDRVVDLCRLIDRKYLSSRSDFRPVDLSRLCSYFTLEVIYTLAFGNTMGFLEHDKDVYGYLDNQKAMLPIFEWLSTLPSLEKFLRTPWISRRIMPRTTDKTGIGLLFKFAEQTIAERRGSKRRDMLDSFLENGVSEEQAIQEAVLQIIAGSDTTAHSIRMTFFYVMTNPHAYGKLTEEIQNAEQHGLLSFPVIQDSEAKRLPYLEACIKEALRLWPPVVGLMSKEVPKGGATLLGKFVPEGTCIGYSAWGLQRKKETFGPDADLYRPERWLPGDGNDAKLADMNKSLEFTFGYGKNACLGKPIAQIEMKKTVAELLRRYDLTIVDPCNPFNSVNRNGLFLQDDMFVTFEKRNK